MALRGGVGGGPVIRSTADDKAAAATVRLLLNRVLHIAGHGASAKMEIDEHSPKSFEYIAAIMDRVRSHPGLLPSLDDWQRDALVFITACIPPKPATDDRGLVLASYKQNQGQWSSESVLRRAITLLGGSRRLKSKPSSQSEIHAAVVKGIPYSALFFLTSNAKGLTEDAVANVVGVSTRTLRRQKDSPEKLMPPDLGSKTWLLAETLAKAEDVLGGKEDAERWMTESAMGLDGARPIDLLRTLQGANLVNQFLERLKYGVYN